MKTTLRDVAVKAGVSHATASKALNGRDDVADATRDAVLKAAAELGYRSRRRVEHANDRSTIAFITDSIDAFYGVEILRGLVEEGARCGFDIVPHVESEQFRPATSHTQWEDLYLGSRVIGIVTAVYGVRGPAFAVANRRGIPMIAIDPYTQSKNATVTISSTNWTGGKTATEHLLDLGHRRIALIGELPEFIPGIERQHGYRAAFSDAGIEVDHNLIFKGQYSFGSGFDAAEQILRLPERPTAVFALNDRMALGAIRAFETHGVRVPDDISVVGYDNSPGTELTTPGLTTIRQPMAAMGRLSVKTLQDIAAGNTRTSRHVKLATSLIVRASTAPPADNVTAGFQR